MSTVARNRQQGHAWEFAMRAYYEHLEVSFYPQQRFDLPAGQHSRVPYRVIDGVLCDRNGRVRAFREEKSGSSSNRGQLGDNVRILAAEFTRGEKAYLIVGTPTGKLSPHFSRPEIRGLHRAIDAVRKQRGVTIVPIVVDSQKLAAHLSKVAARVAKAYPDLGRKMAAGKLTLGAAMAVVRTRGGYAPRRDAFRTAERPAEKSQARAQAGDPAVDPSRLSKRPAPPAKTPTPAGGRVVDSARLVRQAPSASRAMNPAAAAAPASRTITRQFAAGVRSLHRR